MNSLIEEGEEILKSVNYTYPPKKDIFNAFKTKNIKVVILGQDPYPNKNAHGYAFSSLHTVPPSLKNIYKVLNVDCDSGDLSSWVKQGVCLLNCYLTYPDKPSVWEKLVDKYIKYICEKFPNAIFILWGEFAKRKQSIITNTVLTHCHPSPMTGKKFLTCKNFDEVDELINKIYSIKNVGENLEIKITPAIKWDPSYKVEKYLCLAYTDGSYKKNKSAYSIYFPNKVLKFNNLIVGNKSLRLYDATNIVSEGTAILETLKIFYYVRKNYYVYTTFMIVTDSEFWLKIISGEYKATKNLELVKNIIYYNSKVEVEYIHIMSHGKHMKRKITEFCGRPISDDSKLIKELREGNEMADKLAGDLTN